MAVNRYEELKGGDDRPILAFALFYGYTYSFPEGVEALVASADTVEELITLPEVVNCDELNRWQIIDTRTFKITDSGDHEDVFIKDGVQQ